MLGSFGRSLREWYIAGIAICAIFGGFYLASATQTAGSRGNSPITSGSPETLASEKPRIYPPQVASALSAAPASLPASQRAVPPHDHIVAAQPAPVATAGQAPPPSLAPIIVGGDAAAGRQVFKKCEVCHSLEPGKTLVGPSLAGIVGRKAGTELGYDYSPAMKQTNIVWDAKTLDSYLADPQKAVLGNKMPFAGLKTDHDRADVIAFLSSPRTGAPAATAAAAAGAAQTQNAPAAPPTGQTPPASSSGAFNYVPDANYTLRTGIAEGGWYSSVSVAPSTAR